MDTPPFHADRYASLLDGASRSEGPAFAFPDRIDAVDGVITIEDERLLEPSFSRVGRR